MNTMHAIRIHQFGNENVLQYENIDIPTIKSDELLVRVHYAGVNPVDWKIREGYFKQFTVQLAKWKGAYVIGTASAMNKDFLINLGVDEFIDYKTAAFEKVVTNVDVVFDLIGGETLLKSFPLVKKGGTVVTIIDPEGIERATQYSINGKFLFVSPNGKELSLIAQLIDQGKIKPHVGSIFSLKEAAKAHRLSQTHHARGKMVLKIEH